MIKVTKSEDRFRADHGWLDTRWHFSFDSYYDPENMNWGALRVFNDDVIQPAKGFGMHPHRDMEIVTYVIDGELEHQDNQGNRGVVHPGEVQVMSAGTGIVHAEYNHSDKKPVRLIQLWILPRHRNSKPRWEQKCFSMEERTGKLLPVVSSGNVAGTLSIDQDAEIRVAALNAGQEAVHTSRPERKIYLFVISGAITVNGEKLVNGDQARIDGVTELKLRATENAELILLDLPEEP